jgi:hypothetical protein
MPGIGMTLRSARIQRGVTIEQVAQDTRISARFLEALEDEAFDELPAPVYVRGFLRSYANYLRLEPLQLLAQLPASQGGGEALAAAAATREPGDGSPRRMADPFRPLPPARARIIGEDLPVEVGALGGLDPFSARRPESETPLNGGNYEPQYRRGRVGGVLMERGAVYEDDGRTVRLVAILGGAFVVIALLVVGALALGGSGDGERNTLAGNGDSTPTATRTSNPIVVGSATANPSSAVSETATSEDDEDETATPSESTATATADGEDQTTPTSTLVPPTATPTVVIPTATPTVAVPPAHGSGFSECPEPADGQFDCDPPVRVVCPPDGDWFVDYGNDFPVETYGYLWAIANSNGEALTIGNAGCT